MHSVRRIADGPVPSGARFSIGTNCPLPPVFACDAGTKVPQRNAEQYIDAAYLCIPRAAARSVLERAPRMVREESGISLTAGTVLLCIQRTM